MGALHVFRATRLSEGLLKLAVTTGLRAFLLILLWKASGAGLHLGRSLVVALPLETLERLGQAILYTDKNVVLALLAAGVFLLEIIQDTLLVKIGYRAWLAVRLLAGVATGPVDGGRLGGPAWLPAVGMTVLITGFFVWIFGTFASPYTMEKTFAAGLGYAGFWPWGIGLFISTFATFVSRKRVSGIRSLMVEEFAVTLVPDTYALTKRVYMWADRLGLPRPAVGTFDAPNAFATGSRADDAAIAVGIPLVKHLTLPELDAIIVHELGHIATGDMARIEVAEGFRDGLATLTGGFLSVGAKAWAGPKKGRSEDGWALVMMTGLLRILFGWIFLLASNLMLKALSRHREYKADALAAAMVSPEAMIAALKKIYGVAVAPSPAESRYAYAMVRPARVASGSLGVLWAVFDTHPSLDQRIAALEAGVHAALLPRGPGGAAR